MQFYFAPMEGITNYIYRNAHHKFFPGMDKYFTPFLVPNQHHCFSARDRREILPEYNRGLEIVPQLLTNNWQDFVWAAKELRQMGYREVNLNLGCPSATVVTKKKGAGFLGEPKALERFLDQIFEGTEIGISVKTRIGMYDPGEFMGLLEIFNRYPMTELIIHPRIRQDFYRNKPDMAVFGEAVSSSKNTVCYNGDLFTEGRVEAFVSSFPKIRRVMLGRGLLADPSLSLRLTSKQDTDWSRRQKLIDFHGEILEGYRSIVSGDRNVLFKMKEIWGFLGYLFEEPERSLKRIRKAERLPAYEEAVDSLFEDHGLLSETTYFKGLEG